MCDSALDETHMQPYALQRLCEACVPKVRTAHMLHDNPGLETCLKSCAKANPLRVERPSALLFLHVQRTGGNTVMQWLKRFGDSTPLGLERGLSAVWPYGQARCFEALFPAVFPESGGQQEQARVAHLDWRASRVAVEYHNQASHDDFLGYISATSRAISRLYLRGRRRPTSCARSRQSWLTSRTLALSTEQRRLFLSLAISKATLAMRSTSEAA